MSWIQQQEELAYDTQEEYRAVLRAEHFDPYEFFTECEAHDEAYDIREGCPSCPKVQETDRESLLVDGLDFDDIPF